MAKKGKQVPGERELARLAHAAIHQAGEGLEEAEGMLARGRWPLAFSVATLAFEEVGKAIICMMALSMPEDVRAEMPFGEMFTSHTAKITTARFVLTVLGENAPPPLARIFATLDASVRANHETKLRARGGGAFSP